MHKHFSECVYSLKCLRVLIAVSTCTYFSEYVVLILIGPIKRGAVPKRIWTQPL